MSGNWIAVASAEHVARGIAGGFMQVCRGKAAPLRRIEAGERVVYYSPTATFGGDDKLQAFTAIGVVKAGASYQVETAPNFQPFRRDVIWLKAQATPIRPLLDKLEFTAGKRNWGYAFRIGLVAISADDLDRIARAMAAERLTARA